MFASAKLARVVDRGKPERPLQRGINSAELRQGELGRQVWGTPNRSKYAMVSTVLRGTVLDDLRSFPQTAKRDIELAQKRLKALMKEIAP